MSDFHARLANALLMYTAALTLWSFFLYFRKQEISPSLLGALVIDELLFVAQGVLGVILVLQGLAAAVRWVHILYGVVGVITIPALYLFTRGRSSYRDALAYGVTLLFLVGIVLRAASTTPL